MAQLETKTITVECTYARRGDFNKNIIIRGIKTTTGQRYEASPALNGKNANFSTPYTSITDILPGDTGTIHFGKLNGYEFPSFVGFTQ